MYLKRVSWITLNRACNLRCKWCYAQSSGFSKKQEMDSPLYEKIIDIIKGLGIRKVILIGGEPTIHPLFLDMIARAKRQEIGSSVITNGIKFSDKKFLEQAHLNGLNGVTLSLKAPTDKLYKEWTGKPVLASVKRAIENIKEFNIPLSVSLVLSSNLYPYIDELVCLLKDMQLKRVYIDSERPFIVNGEVFSLQNPQDIILGYSELIDKLEKSEIPYVFKASLPFCLFPKTLLAHLKAQKRLEAGCQMLSASGVVFDTNGDFLACNQLCENPLAQFGKDFCDYKTFNEVLMSEKVENFYKLVQSYPNEKCMKCAEWSECGGGCRINWLYQDLLKERR